MGDVVNYDYGNKRHWRRWVWNRIGERASLERSGFILFLAGQEAYDLEIAKKRGFDPGKMIAIERDPVTISKLRARGLLTIEGDLFDVLNSWPQHLPVTAVLGDLCHGLKMRVYERGLDPIWSNQAFNECVWAFNFLRGREKEKAANMVRESIAGNRNGKEAANRAALFFLCAMHYPQIWFSSNTDEGKAFNSVLDSAREIATKIADPAFNYYWNPEKNNGFDSVVFRGPMAMATEFHRTDIRELLSTAIGLNDEAGKKIQMPVAKRQAQRRKIAAVLAHHTRRQPGWGA